MWWRKRDEKAAPAYVLKPGDKFHAILACEPVRYEGNPTTTTLVFYAILRANGLAEIVSVMRSIRRGRIVSEHKQTKPDIPLDRVDAELSLVTGGFTNIIEEASGHRLTWHRLGLADVPDGAEQVRRMREWGRAELP